jgi:hypothetical protein
MIHSKEKGTHYILKENQMFYEVHGTRTKMLNTQLSFHLVLSVYMINIQQNKIEHDQS